jgi:HEAT repeat protein
MRTAFSEMNMSDLPPSLAEALNHHDEMRRNLAWYELLDYARRQHADEEYPVLELEHILLNLLDSQYGDIRAHAAKELGRMRVSAATDKLCALLDDPYYNVRHAAILALGNTNNAVAVPALVNQLQYARNVPLIISSLSDIDHPSVNTAIDTALNDPNPFIRVDVIQGVVDGHYIKAVPILIGMTQDYAELQHTSDGGPTPTVADAAMKALAELRRIANESDIRAYKYTEESLNLLESFF